MSFDVKRQKIVSRRMFIFGLAKTALFSVFAIKIAKIQIFNKTSYTKLSEDNRTRKIIINSKRGIITDRDNVQIAINKSYYRLIFTPSNKEKNHRELSGLGKSLNLYHSAAWHR